MATPDAVRGGPRRRAGRNDDKTRLSARVWRDRLHRTLLDVSMPDSLFIHDNQGWFVEVNTRACESLGYTRDELLAMNVTDVEQDFDRPAAQAAWRCIEEGTQNILYGHHRRKDGSIFPVEVRFGLMQVGRVRFYVGLVSDISSRGTEVETLPMKAALLASAGGRTGAARQHALDVGVEVDSILRGLAALVGSGPHRSEAELEWARAGIARLGALAGPDYGVRLLDAVEALQVDLEAWLGPHAWVVSQADMQAARSELTAAIQELTIMLLGSPHKP